MLPNQSNNSLKKPPYSPDRTKIQPASGPKTASSPKSFCPEDLRYIKGVGPKRAESLKKLGLERLQDFFYFFPNRYEDRTHFTPIASLKQGEFATISAKILSVQFKPIPRLRLVEARVGDATGSISAVWFNQPFLLKMLRPGMEVVLYGKPEWFQNRFQITSPEYETSEAKGPSIHSGRIVPVYPLTAGIFQKPMRQIAWEAIQKSPGRIHDFLPVFFKEAHHLAELSQSIRQIHFPDSYEALEEARRRIIFDEFFLFEISLLKRIQNLKKNHTTISLKHSDVFFQAFLQSLPFQLTSGQTLACKEISRDLQQDYPMNRLLMGDVGSGKTIVGAYALALAVQNGHQAALLVPTEILARQHYRNFLKILKPFDVSVAILTSSTSGPKKEKIIAQLKQGSIQLIIGTHSLIQDDVQFKSLALVTIDEQHKFGVHQRSKLFQREPRPHQLVMTATPIPRTLALTLYGDLDVSTLTDMPKGRQPIQTKYFPGHQKAKVLEEISGSIKRGEQAYFIFPLIEETEKMDLASAVKAYDQMRKGVFSQFKVGLVHGRMSAEERGGIMLKFQEKEISILVATSVLEVGIDNPNATIMVIENAERFGLAQLHQMRGRIGRGPNPSTCYLISDPKSDEARLRMEIMTRESNGFVIAEEDLKMRGHGDFWGTRQSGEPLFKLANPILHGSILSEAREAAIQLLKNSQWENSPQWRPLKNVLEMFALKY